MAAGVRSGIYQRRELALRESRLQTLEYKLQRFGGRGLLKASQKTGQPEEIPHENISGDPLDTVRATIAERPERLKACTGAEGIIFSDIIINKYLK